MAFPIAAVLGGIGALGSLFGRKKSNAGTGMQQDGMTAMKRAQGVRDDYLGLAGEAGADADMLAPQSGQALSRLRSVLGRSASAGDRNAFIADQTADVDRAFDGAQANLMARRASGLGPTSLDVGREAILDSHRAAAVGQAENAARNLFDERERDDSQILFSLLHGLESEAQNRELAGLGAAGSLDQWEAATLLGGANAEKQLEQQKQGSWMNLLGSLGGAAGAYFGAKK